jgi:hypothetical protein
LEWRHREAAFEYVGSAARYTCDGLEAKTRAILAYLGARGDMKILARGCPGGPDVPSRTASVHVEFYVPSAAGGAEPTDRAAARWTAVELTPRRPGFLQAGDCELMEGIKDLVVRNFDVRRLSYRTSCFPGELNQWGFSVSGEVFKTQPGAP